MANHKGVKHGIPLEKLIDEWVGQDGNIAATARALDCERSNVRKRLQKAYDAGDERIDPRLLFNRPAPINRTLEEINAARVELGLRNERKQAKGDWRKPSLINIPHDVFLLGIFGDPHLDNSGTDLDMFEEALERRNPDEGVYTACGGDFFDNWTRAMGHLYKESGDPYPAWVVFEDMMDRHPFLFSVSGNHDQFTSGTADFLSEFMRARGMLLRRSGGRFILQTPTGKAITVALRHIWQGNSQYSEAHNLKRAVTFGHTEDDLIGGFHFHKGELRTHVRPHDGKVMKLAQVSSFKRLDNYANDRGFMSPETSPVVWAVCDSREPFTSHNRVQLFYDFDAARAVMMHQRGKNHFEAT